MSNCFFFLAQPIRPFHWLVSVRLRPFTVSMEEHAGHATRYVRWKALGASQCWRLIVVAKFAFTSGKRFGHAIQQNDANRVLAERKRFSYDSSVDGISWCDFGNGQRRHGTHESLSHGPFRSLAKGERFIVIRFSKCYLRLSSYALTVAAHQPLLRLPCVRLAAACDKMHELQNGLVRLGGPMG